MDSGKKGDGTRVLYVYVGIFLARVRTQANLLPAGCTYLQNNHRAVMTAPLNFGRFEKHTFPEMFACTRGGEERKSYGYVKKTIAY